MRFVERQRLLTRIERLVELLLLEQQARLLQRTLELLGPSPRQRLSIGAPRIGRWRRDTHRIVGSPPRGSRPPARARGWRVVSPRCDRWRIPIGIGLEE